MKILLLYDNFLRDYRGLLLLKHLLKIKGHKVWIWASWRNPIHFAKLINPDVIVAGQIAEGATHGTGKFAKENNIRLVLNSTENVSIPSNFEIFITYNTSSLNEEVIDLQTIAAKDVYDFIINHQRVKPENKNKYKFLGFPRMDLVMNESFRSVEVQDFRTKYKLPASGRVFLFISSFLFDSSYDGVPQKDLEKWNYAEIKERTENLLSATNKILFRLVEEELGANDVLLIKKHPWDCSSYFKDNYTSKKCIILDNDEYIIPCLVNSDVIIHTYSTSAIEAWVLNKKTISILSEKYRSTFTLNHMKNEITVSSFEEFKAELNNYPAENPSIKALDIFSPNLDGQATARLAAEIDKLTPHPEKTVFKFSIKQRIKNEMRVWLMDKGFLKLDPDRFAKPNTKSHDFHTWENQRALVIKKYDKHFRRYANQYYKKNH